MLINSDFTRMGFDLADGEGGDEMQVFWSKEKVEVGDIEGGRHIPRYGIVSVKNEENWSNDIEVVEWKRPSAIESPRYMTIHKGEYSSPFHFKDALVLLGVIK
jgi:hypothetical protein